MAVLRMAAIMFVVNAVIMDTASSYTLEENYDCHADPYGHAYRGNLSKTWANRTCRSWTDGLLVAYNLTAKNDPSGGLGDHNYCRNSAYTKAAAPFCFTEAIGAIADYCELGMFHPDCRIYSDDPQECFVSGRDYRGHVNVTQTGIPCQKWSVQEPQPHPYTQEAYPTAGLGDHNYCRNPAPTHYYAWCYTTQNQIEWEYCNVGLPKPTCSDTCRDDD